MLRKSTASLGLLLVFGVAALLLTLAVIFA
jgi:hypothetical protein